VNVVSQLQNRQLVDFAFGLYLNFVKFSNTTNSSNLSRNVTKAHLEEIFTLFGVLKSCELPMDRLHSHLPRGYGYVEYDKSEDAEKAMKHMDGAQIDGLEIQCEITLPYRGNFI
jgi:RNA recognition motif-containing protein